jgi:hypothetical protein
MKKFATAFALATLIASPALAKTHRQLQNEAAQSYAAAPSDYVMPRTGVVVDHGQYAGQDPDPSIRAQLLREHDFNQW